MPPRFLKISEHVTIPTDAIEISAIRAQGAGGQNVNKVSSAVHLRFDIQQCAAIPEDARKRLLAANDRRITADGVIVIKAQSYRTQDKNIKDGMQRLSELIAQSLVVAKPRKKSKPSKAVKKKRVDNKRRRGQLKQARRQIDD